MASKWLGKSSFLLEKATYCHGKAVASSDTTQAKSALIPQCIARGSLSSLRLSSLRDIAFQAYRV